MFPPDGCAGFPQALAVSRRHVLVEFRNCLLSVFRALSGRLDRHLDFALDAGRHFRGSIREAVCLASRLEIRHFLGCRSPLVPCRAFLSPQVSFYVAARCRVSAVWTCHVFVLPPVLVYATGSIRNFVHLIGRMRFSDTFRRRSTRRTLWPVDCGPQPTP